MLMMVPPLGMCSAARALRRRGPLRSTSIVLSNSSSVTPTIEVLRLGRALFRQMCWSRYGIRTMWDFETDAEYQRDLDWAAEFVGEEVEPLQFVLPNALERENPVWREVVPPLQQQVKDRGLWATHLGPELGGQGHGQVKLALLNEILGGVGLDRKSVV